jgi:hypothetical protein
MGDVVASRNKGGQYLRARVSPVNPNTSRQQAVRNAMNALVVAWSDVLTQAQRDAWDAYGAAIAMTDRLGDTIYLSGLNHFVRSNLPIIQGGGTRVDAGPTTLTLAETDPAFVPSISVAGGNISVVFDAGLEWCDEDGAHLLLSMAKPHGAGRTFIGGPYRYAGVVDGSSTTPPTSPATVAWPFVPAEGDKTIVRARIARADGRVSPLFQSTVTVAA